MEKFEISRGVKSFAARFFKEEGCNKMKCPKCGQSMCYLCRYCWLGNLKFAPPHCSALAVLKIRCHTCIWKNIRPSGLWWWTTTTTSMGKAAKLRRASVPSGRTTPTCTGFRKLAVLAWCKYHRFLGSFNLGCDLFPFTGMKW